MVYSSNKHMNRFAHEVFSCGVVKVEFTHVPQDYAIGAGKYCSETILKDSTGIYITRAQ